MSREKAIGLLSWLGVLVLVAAFLGPVWNDFSHSVVGPFGENDALLQLGLVEWSVRHWDNLSRWRDLPIFYPVPGVLGFMDSLVGQALLVAPVRWFFSPTVAGQYNLAYLGSLLLAALAMASLWLASGGSRWASGVAALALIGAPFTLAQLGHLNQLPPPFVLFSLAALVAALRRHNAGLSSSQFWWLLGGCLVVQAAWGWYGFAYAAIGVAVLETAWLVHRIRRRTAGRDLFISLLRKTLLPFILTIAAVGFLAGPQLELQKRYPDLQRTDQDIRLGSADVQHFFNRGVYRSGPSDWLGKGSTGEDRYLDRERQVLHPGWVALALFAVGWWRRGHLAFHRRRFGRALLVMGVLGLALSFGDSVGIPGTSHRWPLPLDLLRELFPPVKAFRGAWRFSWLMVVALSWWSAVGVEQLVLKYRSGHRRWAAPLLPVVVLFLVSLPAAIPSLPVPLEGRPGPRVDGAGPVLTLPAPATEDDEDRTEALWLTRSLTTGQAVTGGAIGWVPPEIRLLRSRMADCEEGREEVDDFLVETRNAGIGWMEIALRPGDEKRVTFWRDALLNAGAVRDDPWPQVGYEMYRFPLN
jgi:hypothetical protein